MIYSLLADFVLVTHLLFILFVVLGGLLVFKRKWVLPIHLVAAAWGVLIEVFYWGCPLTPLEKYFRLLAGEQGYEGGFIEHYGVAIIYPDGLTSPIRFGLAAFVIVINFAIYTIYLRRWRKSKS